MKFQTLVSSVLVILFVFSCSSPDENSLLSAEKQVFDYMDNLLPSDHRQRFIDDDPELTGQDYEAIRQYIKASLMTNDSLIKVFENNEIGDLDILPKALADCYEDYLQDSTYNVKAHYTELMDRWIPVRDCRAFLLAEAKGYFRDYMAGDTITLTAPYYSTSTGYEIDIVEGFCGANKWEFNTQIDELYHAVLLNKNVSNNGKNYKFLLKVIYMNDNQNRRSGNTIKLGDEIEFKVNSPLRIVPFDYDKFVEEN